MPYVPIVENPRRRHSHRRHRSLTARQKRYGFGGRAAMRTGRPSRSRRRRRNPEWLASLANPRRRHRSYRYHHRSYHYRARRNPSFLSGLTGSINVMDGVWVATGALGSTVIPGLVKRFVPQIPSTGVMSYVLRIGGTAVTAFGVKLLTGGGRASRAFSLVWAGGLAFVLVDLFRDYVAPRLGLSGLGLEDQFVLTREIQDALPGGTSGYEVVYKPKITGISGYRLVDTYNPAVGF
jgi:hypothetical protein